jgi:hypothetical protein
MASPAPSLRDRFERPYRHAHNPEYRLAIVRQNKTSAVFAHRARFSSDFLYILYLLKLIYFFGLDSGGTNPLFR